MFILSLFKQIKFILERTKNNRYVASPTKLMVCVSFISCWSVLVELLPGNLWRQLVEQMNNILSLILIAMVLVKLGFLLNKDTFK